jgi:hypothetical protein
MTNGSKAGKPGSLSVRRENSVHQRQLAVSSASDGIDFCIPGF